MKGQGELLHLFLSRLKLPAIQSQPEINPLTPLKIDIRSSYLSLSLNTNFNHMLESNSYGDF